MTNFIKAVSVIVFLCGTFQQATSISETCAKGATCFTGVVSPECDEDPIIVRGHALTVSGTPINNVTVKMLQGGVVKNQTTTNSSGEYCMGGFDAGSYVLNFTRTGYLPKNVNLTFSSEVVRIDTLIAP